MEENEAMLARVLEESKQGQVPVDPNNPDVANMSYEDLLRL